MISSPVLFLDGGHFTAVRGPNRKIMSKLSLDVMGKMRYDVMNACSRDMTEFSRENPGANQRIAALPFVSANLSLSGSDSPDIKKFIIKNIGGINIGITGITPPPDLEDKDQEVLGITVAQPIDSLKNVLKDMANKTDITLVFSMYGANVNQLVADTLTGIDLIIASGTKGNFNTITPPFNTPVFLPATSSCSSMGVVKLIINPDKTIAAITPKRVTIGIKYDDDPEILKMVGPDAHQTAEMIMQKAFAREIQRLHDLSPEEYTEMMRKLDQSSKNTKKE